MPRPKKPSTAPISDAARQLHAAEPALTTGQIAARLTVQLRRPVSIQVVQSALRYASGRRGRKPDPAARVARLRRELAEAERELSAAGE